MYIYTQLLRMFRHCAPPKRPPHQRGGGFKSVKMNEVPKCSKHIFCLLLLTKRLLPPYKMRSPPLTNLIKPLAAVCKGTKHAHVLRTVADISE